MHHLPFTRTDHARIALAASLAFLAIPVAHAAQNTDSASTKGRPAARAEIRGLDGSQVSGEFTLSRAANFVFIEGMAKGLAPGKHGMHIHEGKSCEHRGGHFNPSKAPHGSPDQPAAMRHVGDLGNLVVGEDGTGRFARIDALARLAGPHSVVGRVLVIHSGEDNYLSQPSGDSGKEIACGVIQGIRR